MATFSDPSEKGLKAKKIATKAIMTTK
jgi:hypothetical protein